MVMLNHVDKSHDDARVPGREEELVRRNSFLHGFCEMTDQEYPPPTAPPRQGIVPPPPPTYEDVVEHDEHRAWPRSRIVDTLTSSMALAGK